jgi:hypothetical protein
MSNILSIEKQILRDIAKLVRYNAQAIGAQPSSKFLLPVSNAIVELLELATKLEVIAE